MQIQHHCLPNMNLSFKKRACRCWSRCNGLCLVSVSETCKQKLNRYRSSRDRLCFYAEIQIIFGSMHCSVAIALCVNKAQVRIFLKQAQKVRFSPISSLALSNCLKALTYKLYEYSVWRF